LATQSEAQNVGSSATANRSLIRPNVSFSRSCVWFQTGRRQPSSHLFGAVESTAASGMRFVASNDCYVGDTCHPTRADRRAALDHLKTFGVVDVTDSFCWNSPFGSRKLAGQQCAHFSPFRDKAAKPKSGRTHGMGRRWAAGAKKVVVCWLSEQKTSASRGTPQAALRDCRRVRLPVGLELSAPDFSPSS